MARWIGASSFEREIALARRQRRDYPYIASLAVKRRIRGAARPAESRPSSAQRIASGWTTLRNFVLNVGGALVFVGASWRLWDAVTKPTIAIAPISMPEELQKKGYTRQGLITAAGPMPPMGPIIKNSDELWKILTFIRSRYDSDPAYKYGIPASLR